MYNEGLNAFFQIPCYMLCIKLFPVSNSLCVKLGILEYNSTKRPSEYRFTGVLVVTTEGMLPYGFTGMTLA